MSFTQEEKDKILLDCYADPALYCKTFHEEQFPGRMPWVHLGMLSCLTGRSQFLLKYGDLRKLVTNFVHDYPDGSSRQVFHVWEGETEITEELVLDHLDRCILAGDDLASEGFEIRLDLGAYTLFLMPRGSSKTTLAGLAVPCYKILFNLLRFILYVSKAGPHSQGQLESVRKELATNEAILEFFGDLKPNRSAEERWSKEKFETVSGIAMQYRGKGSAIRGVNHNNHRPDLIIIDDPQDKDDVRSDTVREEDKRWAFAELTPARRQIIGSEGQLFCLATWLHMQCLAAIFSRDPKWTTVKMGVKDRDGDFIWEEYMDEEKYEMEKASYARAGLLGDFHREYDNQEVLDTEVLFPRKFIIYEPELPAREDMVVATYCDPATSEKRDADYTAIVTVGLTTKGKCWVLDCWMERTSDEEKKIEEFFRQSLAWQSQLHGFEANAYQAAFGAQIRAQMFARHHYFELEPVTHKTRKVDRVRAALRPRYASGWMRHRLPFDLLETQLEEFRMDNSHDHDDGPDAVAAAVVLLDPAAAFHAEDDPTKDSDTDITDWVEDEGVCDWAS